MSETNAYVGLDVHKETIAVVVALTGREEPELIKRHAAHRWTRTRSGLRR